MQSARLPPGQEWSPPSVVLAGSVGGSVGGAVGAAVVVVGGAKNKKQCSMLEK